VISRSRNAGANGVAHHIGEGSPLPAKPEIVINQVAATKFAARRITGLEVEQVIANGPYARRMQPREFPAA